jgi:rubrerythrin
MKEVECMNTLNLLINFENDCLCFYNELIAETADPDLKGLYGLLADTRKRHMGLLESLKESVNSDDLKSELAERAGRVMNVCRMALLNHNLAREMRNDPDAFTHVVQAEEEMIRLCEGMAKAEEAGNIKGLLNWFVNDEKRYVEEVGGIYEFVEAPHSYLEWGEFSNLRSL